jgi:GR25 family glycosyltransferase involved in LPS biosynthesis
MIYKETTKNHQNSINIDNYFDKVLYINMNKDVDRNQNMINQFEKYGITNYHRIEGIEPDLNFTIDDIDTNQIRNFIKNDPKYIIGTYFCRASHLKAVQYAKDNNYKKVLIFEDDVIFLSDPNKILQSNINILNNWDMLFFGGMIETMFRNQIVEAHAYALNYKIYDDILNMGVPSGMEIDNFYAKIIQHMSYNHNQSGKYKITPFNTIIQDKNFKSNIQK